MLLTFVILYLLVSVGIGLVANDGAHGWTPDNARFADQVSGDRVGRLAAIVAASMLSAPFGARTAHAWPVAKLRRAFGIELPHWRASLDACLAEKR